MTQSPWVNSQPSSSSPSQEVCEAAYWVPAVDVLWRLAGFCCSVVCLVCTLNCSSLRRGPSHTVFSGHVLVPTLWSLWSQMLHEDPSHRSSSSCWYPGSPSTYPPFSRAHGWVSLQARWGQWGAQPHACLTSQLPLLHHSAAMLGGEANSEARLPKKPRASSRLLSGKQP